MGATVEIPHWLPELVTALVVIGVAWGMMRARTEDMRRALETMGKDHAAAIREYQQGQAEYQRGLGVVREMLVALDATVRTMVQERGSHRDSLEEEVSLVRGAVHDVRNKVQEQLQELLDRVSRLEGFYDGSMSGPFQKKEKA